MDLRALRMEDRLILYVLPDVFFKLPIEPIELKLRRLDSLCKTSLETIKDLKG